MRAEPHAVRGILAAVVCALGASAPAPAAAHAALVDARLTGAVVVRAQYDTGAPMGGAQVAVFAPDDPRTPWLRGETDAKGLFVFVPDDRAGRWTVQARQAGHGGMATVTLDGANGGASATPAGIGAASGSARRCSAWRWRPAWFGASSAPRSTSAGCAADACS